MTTFQRCRSDRSVGFQRCRADRSVALRLQPHDDIIFGASDDAGFTRREIVGAALAGTATGAVIAAGGPMGAIAMGAGAALAAARLESELGEFARSVGEKVANLSQAMLTNDTVDRTLKHYSAQRRLANRMKNAQSRALVVIGED